MKWVARLAWWGVVAALFLFVGWASLVMAFCLPGPAWLRQGVALALPLAFLFTLWGARQRRQVVVAAVGLFAIGLTVFWAQAARNDRSWCADVAVLPWAEIDGDRVTMHNIRCCDYRSESDFTVRHHDDTFDLSKLTGVDLFHVYWGSPNIAHTMLSFGFQDGRHLCLSVETRREQGEVYDALKGFFRQYELIYVFADETDLEKLRTNFRGEQVYLYPLAVPLD
ncbi:MAG: DUF4105 domain-containing protein, partial [Planctomycetota bacterium]